MRHFVVLSMIAAALLLGGCTGGENAGNQAGSNRGGETGQSRNQPGTMASPSPRVHPGASEGSSQ